MKYCVGSLLCCHQTAKFPYQFSHGSNILFHWHSYGNFWPLCVGDILRVAQLIRHGNWLVWGKVLTKWIDDSPKQFTVYKLYPEAVEISPWFSPWNRSHSYFLKCAQKSKQNQSEQASETAWNRDLQERHMCVIFLVMLDSRNCWRMTSFDVLQSQY